MTIKSELQSTAVVVMLPLDQLRIDDKANVRHIGRGATPQFVASIRAHGIKQPLIVRPNGRGYLVTDGGKRLEAAQALVKSGTAHYDGPAAKAKKAAKPKSKKR